MLKYCYSYMSKVFGHSTHLCSYQYTINLFVFKARLDIPSMTLPYTLKYLLYNSFMIIADSNHLCSWFEGIINFTSILLFHRKHFKLTLHCKAVIYRF